MIRKPRFHHLRGQAASSQRSPRTEAPSGDTKCFRNNSWSVSWRFTGSAVEAAQVISNGFCRDASMYD